MSLVNQYSHEGEILSRLTIVEESLDHDVWGNYIDVEINGEEEELFILEVANKYVKRKHRIIKNGKKLGKGIRARIDELKRRGVKSRRRGRK